MDDFATIERRREDTLAAFPPDETLPCWWAHYEGPRRAGRFLVYGATEQAARAEAEDRLRDGERVESLRWIG